MAKSSSITIYREKSGWRVVCFSGRIFRGLDRETALGIVRAETGKIEKDAQEAT